MARTGAAVAQRRMAAGPLFCFALQSLGILTWSDYLARLPGRRKIAAPPPLRAGAACGTDRPLGRLPARPPGGIGVDYCPGSRNDTGINMRHSAYPPRQISAGHHEARDILRRDLSSYIFP